MAKTGRAFFQRTVLGLMLLCMAVLFVWSEAAPGAEPVRLSVAWPGSSRGEQSAEAPAPAFAEEAALVQEPPLPDGAAPVDIIGLNDIIFQPEGGPLYVEESLVRDAATPRDLDKLYDFNYLTSQFYMADADTGLLPADIDAEAFMRADIGLDTAGSGPKILIFHTHSTEMYADSAQRDTAYATDPMEGVMGAGRELARFLTERHGIEVLHHTGRFDVVNGAAQISGAYERMEPSVRQLLADNPSIQLAIDLHRDGLREGVPPMVTEVNGQPAARVMLVNGLSRTRRGDAYEAVPWLPNPYITDNLTFSFRAQLTANALYPGFARKVYLKPYRYSLHVLPRTLLVEVGAQNNTKREAYNAAEALAEVIAQVARGG